MDSVIDDIVGSHEINLSEHDTDGRNLFLKQKEKNQFVVCTPAIAEILALSSIINVGGVREDQEIFFASINKFKSNGDLKANELLDGNIKRVSTKGGFDRYHGVLKSDTSSASCDIMAFYKDKNMT